ncbi:MAG TPA: formate dehydrogenase accessory protein FdhE [Vicinamibacterales bacterium]|nr:formate dehydrogenase accessory protein FdhE [Vicinamibacterales bacterium]
MSDRPPRPARAEPREVVELKQLKATNPDLADAVDMQVALVDIQRRVQGRVPLPRLQPDATWLAAQQESGRPAVRFDDIPLDWSDFRLTLRQTADVLYRFRHIERADLDQVQTLTREGNALEPLVTNWYLATSGVEPPPAPPRLPEGAPESLDVMLLLAIRPFLARCSEALMPRPDFSRWAHGHCPVCGWEAEFAVVTPSGERRLICGRCVAQWNYGAHTCPYCTNDDRSLVTSFATRDGRYRVYGCDVCKRYLKAYDARNATRPVMLSVDSLATLPLDAAAQQRGYVG